MEGENGKKAGFGEGGTIEAGARAVNENPGCEIKREKV